MEEIRDTILVEQPTWKRDLTREAQGLIEDQFEVKADLNQLRMLREAQAALAAQLAELENKIVEQIRGRRMEDLPTREQQRYAEGFTNNASDKDFERYPAGSRSIVLGHCERMADVLTAHHPIGKRIQKLKEDGATFEDNIAACGSHKQLQEIWSEIKGALDIFELDASATREKRKVDLTRARKKEEKAAAKAAKGKP